MHANIEKKKTKNFELLAKIETSSLIHTVNFLVALFCKKLEKPTELICQTVTFFRQIYKNLYPVWPCLLNITLLQDYGILTEINFLKQLKIENKNLSTMTCLDILFER
jgi:hypothetical protein